MNKKSPQVDGFLRKSKRWQKELSKLRAIALDSDLTEEMKWRAPCYTFQKKNIILLNGFKEFCVVMFVKGVLLKDAEGVLAMPGENSQAVRWMKFTNVREIARMQPILKSYISEAIAVEKAGLKVKLKKTSDFKIPEEFQEKLDEIPALKAAFAALTPGRQRGYLYYISGAKQSQTRASRVLKCMPGILKGKGLFD